MAKILKFSLIAMVALCMIALGATFSSGVAMAQDDASKQAAGPGHPPENPGSRSETAMDFDKYMRKNPQVRQEVEKDPSLLNNPDYLAKHPDLQKFMNQHPDFQRAAAKNPDRMVRKSRGQQRRAVRRHREGKDREAKPMSTGQAKPR
jgi:hypothetical protein